MWTERLLILLQYASSCETSSPANKPRGFTLVSPLSLFGDKSGVLWNEVGFSGIFWTGGGVDCSGVVWTGIGWDLVSVAGLENTSAVVSKIYWMCQFEQVPFPEWPSNLLEQWIQQSSGRRSHTAKEVCYKTCNHLVSLYFANYIPLTNIVSHG